MWKGQFHKGGYNFDNFFGGGELSDIHGPSTPFYMRKWHDAERSDVAKRHVEACLDIPGVEVALLDRNHS